MIDFIDFYNELVNDIGFISIVEHFYGTDLYNEKGHHYVYDADFKNYFMFYNDSPVKHYITASEFEQEKSRLQAIINRT